MHRSQQYRIPAAAGPGRAPGRGVLVGLRDVELRRLPRPGEEVFFRAEVERRLPPLVLVRGEARAGAPGGELLCRGGLKLHVAEGS